MMFKKKSRKPVKAILKLEIQAGKATPAPPIGPALGQHGINIGEFVKQYNDLTKENVGEVVPCILTIFEDRSFTIELKSTPVASMIKKMLGIEKGSAVPNKTKVGSISAAQIKEIAEKKLPDLNAISIDAAINIVKGTAKSMGLNIVE